MLLFSACAAAVPRCSSFAFLVEFRTLGVVVVCRCLQAFLRTRRPSHRVIGQLGRTVKSTASFFLPVCSQQRFLLPQGNFKANFLNAVAASAVLYSYTLHHLRRPARPTPAVVCLLSRLASYLRHGIFFRIERKHLRGLDEVNLFVEVHEHGNAAGSFVN